MVKMKNESFIKILAMVIIAVMWLGSMFGLYGCAISASNDNSATSKVNIEINGIDTGDDENVKTVPVKKLENERRVLLVDASGSMDENASITASGYDTTHTFSDYIGQSRGNSLICTNIDMAFDLGVKELGVVTDLESYPESDLDIFGDKKYENVELTFFLPEDVKEENVKKYKALFREALNEDNCSLIFINSDGSQLVVFDNYEKDIIQEEVVEETEKTDENISVNVEAESNGGNNGTLMTTMLMILFSIIMALIEVILVIALRKDHEKETVAGTPGEIKEALKCATALDGSGSVSNIYKKLIDWAKNEKVNTVYRFATRVEKIALRDAENYTAGGNTCGWECLRTMCEAGEKDITIVSDMEFSDTEISGIFFDHVNFVVPPTYNKETVEKIIKISKTHKVISV